MDDTIIEKVKEYRYLCQIISFTNKSEKELKIRRSNAWKAFWAQRHLLKGNLNIKTKMRVLESTIIPILLYGAQTWALMAKQIKKLQVTQNGMLRSLLNIRLKDKVSLADIYNKTNAKKVRVTARVPKFKYAGHAVRDNKEKWNTLLTDWVPHWGKRKRGRPPLAG